MNDIQQALEQALPKIANRLRNELVLVCPVDTGLLRNSIKIHNEGNTLIIWMLDYGIFVEFGTKNQRPNPFIRNTIRNKLNKIVQEEIQKYF